MKNICFFLQGTPLPQLEDDHWLNDFAYLTDLSEQLNKLNSRLQGRNQNIVQMYDKIKSFVLSLDTWMSNLKERQFHNFVCLQTRPRVSDEQLYTYVSMLEILKNEFEEKRFNDCKVIENDFTLFVNVFSVDIMSVRPELQAEVADVQTDSYLKSKCKDLLGLDVFKNLPTSEYGCLRTFAANIEAMFGSTYICEQFFSKLKTVKSHSRSRIADANLHAQLKVAACDIEIDLNSLVS